MASRLFGVLELLGLGVWIGSILFFSTAAAPTAFQALDAEQASLYIRAIFPRYYAFTLISGILTVICGIVARLMAGNWGRVSVICLTLMAAMLADTVYSRQILMPQIEANREARAHAVAGSAEHAQATAAFRAGHLLSTLLNGLVLLVGIGVFLMTCWSRFGPRSV